MAKPTEERFNNFATVYDLKQFLLEKRARLEREIKERKFADDKIGMAMNFVGKINEILGTVYFKATNYGTKIYELMRRLKEDDVDFGKEIGRLEEEIKKMEYKLEHFESDNLDPEYAIPGEIKEYQMAITTKKREYLWNVEKVREELRVYKYRLELCRKLKGIMCRPNGFFGSLYK